MIILYALLVLLVKVLVTTITSLYDLTIELFSWRELPGMYSHKDKSVLICITYLSIVLVYQTISLPLALTWLLFVYPLSFCWTLICHCHKLHDKLSPWQMPAAEEASPAASASCARLLFTHRRQHFRCSYNRKSFWTISFSMLFRVW